MKKYFLYIFILVTIGAGCKKDEVAYTEEQKALYYINKSIYEAVNEYYLWYPNIPKTLDYKQEPPSFFEGLKYKEKDRWSFILDKATFYINFLGGNVSGSHGFDILSDANGQMRVAYVYPNTLAYKTGVRRGWIVSKVNGQTPTYENFYTLQGDPVAGSVDAFDFLNAAENITLDLKKEDFVAPTVLAKDTLHIGNTVAAYIMYNEFRGADSQAELDSAFDYFKSVGATELILDMRYNGGGMNETAHHLGDLIAGNANAGQVFVKYTYNDKLAKEFNGSASLKALPSSITLPNNRIYIIATANTASASEIIINCLKPFMTVYLIGSKTHGKPVGMNVLDLKYYDYIIAPISFTSVNKNNEGDYFGGIEVNSPTTDDLTHDFGDRNESCLAQALTHIKTGAFNPALKSEIMDSKPVKLRTALPFPMSINKIITIE